MNVPSAPQLVRPGLRKDHCDYLLDSIDDQLRQLQVNGPKAEISNNSNDEKSSPGETIGISSPADLGRCTEDRHKGASMQNDWSSWEGECTPWLGQLPDPGVAPSEHSKSESVCTEDFVARFNEGLVDPLLSSEGEDEEDSVLHIRPPKDKAKNHSLCRGTDLVDPAGKEVMNRLISLETSASSHRTPSLCTQRPMKSLESFGERISLQLHQRWSNQTLSLTDTPRERVLWHDSPNLGEKSVGLEMDIPRKNLFLDPQQGRNPSEGSSELIQGSHDNLSNPLLLQDLGPSRPFTAMGATVLNGKALPEILGPRYPKERWQSEDGSCLCALKASQKSCLGPSDPESRDVSVTHGHLYPLVSSAPGKMEARLLSLSGRNTDLPGTPVAASAATNPMKVHLPPQRGALKANQAQLELKREAPLRQLLELKKDLHLLRKQHSQYGTHHMEVSQLVKEREELRNQVCHLQENLSSLQHQLRASEMDTIPGKETIGFRTEDWQEAAHAAQELDKRIQGLELRTSTLQMVLSRKNTELSRLRETISALEAERAAQETTMEKLRKDHKDQLEKLRDEALQEKMEEQAQLREEWQCGKQEALSEIAETLERAKTRALEEQANTFRKQLEELHKTIEDRETELVRQQRDMEQQIQNLMLKEQKKWESDVRDALQLQREILEEQKRVDLQKAMEKERKVSLELLVENTDLCKRIQELENKAKSFQREKKAAMEELQVQLEKEKSEALRRLQDQLREGRKEERDYWRVKLGQVEEDQQHLGAEQNKVTFWVKESEQNMDWAQQPLAREVISACQQLQDLLPKKTDTPVPIWLRRDPALGSTTHILQALQNVSKDLRCYLQELKQEAEQQRQKVLQLQKDKERELMEQQERLRSERRAALEALKEHLVQEHMQDIASLQRTWVKEAKVFCPHHQGKDDDLQLLQRSLVQQRGKTAGEAVDEFKEDPNGELEKCLTRNKPMDIHMKFNTPEAEIRHFRMGRSEYFLPWSSYSSPNGPSFSSPSKVPSSLQNRIQALRAENATFCRAPLDSGSNSQDDSAYRCKNKGHLSSEFSFPYLPGETT